MSAHRWLERCAAFTVLAVSTRGLAQSPRALEINDIIELQDVRQMTVSPDGDLIAAVIKRPGSPVLMNDDENSDIWILSRRDGAARNITATYDKDTRWWAATWSPDGAHLALLSSTRGKNNATPYIWTPRTGALTPLSDRNVDNRAATDDAWPTQPLVWVDSVTLVCPVLPVAAYVGSADSRIQYVAPREWEKTAAGVEPAVSVLESGREVPASERPQGQLLRIDVRTAASTVLANGNFWRISISPTRRFAALIEDRGHIPPVASQRLSYDTHFYGDRRTRLVIVRLDSSATERQIETISDPNVPDGFNPHSWSPDGATLAVVGKSGPGEAYGSTLYVVSVATGSTRRITDRTWDVERTAWTRGGTLLTMARRTAFAPSGTDTVREDWWVADPHSLANAAIGMRVTGDLPVAPQDLIPEADSRFMLGIAGGKLQEIDVTGGAHQGRPTMPLAIGNDTIRDFIWPTGAGPLGAQTLAVFVQTKRGDIYRIELSSRQPIVPKLVPKPSPQATLSAVDVAHGATAFVAKERTGMFLWTGDDSTSHFHMALALNQHVGAIADPKRLLIRYVGADGDSLSGVLALPIGYIPGHRYPLVTWVYGGVVVHDTTDRWLPILIGKQTVIGLPLALFPAHGYALLIPSMPLENLGQAGDPMIDMPKGVLAAVDEAVHIGVADPERLGIFGHSYGGYSVYSLLTYTHRFRAAAALAGFADMPSMYGEFDPRQRYSEFGYERQLWAGSFEAGQFEMGESPWGNLWRYLRNSPYFFADRIQTPLMIIQGDADAISMEQGEEMFTALYRLGKPAKFVRYWGETHVISRSPANMRDMWQRLFDWFDSRFNTKDEARALGGS